MKLHTRDDAASGGSSVDNYTSHRQILSCRHCLHRQRNTQCRGSFGLVWNIVGRQFYRTIGLIAAWHAAVEPGEKRRHLARVEARIGFVFTVTARKYRRRHPVLDELLADRPSPGPRISEI